MKFDIDRLILEQLKQENDKPIPKGILIKKITDKNKDINVKDIFKSIKFLSVKGHIRELQSGKIVLGYQDGNVIPNSNKTGIISLNIAGDGFIKDEETGLSIAYINHKNLLGALDGDEVEYVLFDKKTKDDLQDGKVIKVINNNKSTYTATFFKTDKGIWFEVDDTKVYQKVYVDDVKGLDDKDKVVLKFFKIDQDRIKAKVLIKFASKNDLNSDVLSIVYDQGVVPTFSDKVLEAANALKKQPLDTKNRIDIRNIPLITIDPAESKDLDDSIYVKKNDNGTFKLIVSIADVAHYVRPDTLLDKEALERATSIYLVDKVIPMLPNVLSDDLCSLNPHEDKLAMTCEMDIDAKGNIFNHKVYQSVMNSHHRYSYDEVNAYYDGKYQEQDLILKQLLDDAYELYQILQNKFEQRGYIDFKINEPKIIVDERGKVIDIKTYNRGHAQMMIEDFMVSANEATTYDFIKAKKDFIFRIHDKPSELKLKKFMIESKKIGFKFDDDIHDIKSNTISRWIRENENFDFNLLSKILLKTMSKAEYSKNNIGHFGLASESYTHFTSPIRRYPDVIAHRLYKMFFLDKESYTDKQRHELINQLDFICKQSSEREQRAVQIERDVNSLKFAEYMESKIGNEYEGIISHITSFGVFVELDNCVEGLCKIKNIKIEDYFRYDTENCILIGEKTNKVISFGNKVKIKVIGSSAKLRQIDFEILEIL